MPDRPFRELETGADLAHRRPEIDEIGKAGPDGDMRCHGKPLAVGRLFMPPDLIPYIGNQLRDGRLCTTGPGTAMSIRPIT